MPFLYNVHLLMLHIINISYKIFEFFCHIFWFFALYILVFKSFLSSIYFYDLRSWLFSSKTIVSEWEKFIWTTAHIVFTENRGGGAALFGATVENTTWDSQPPTSVTAPLVSWAFLGLGVCTKHVDTHSAPLKLQRRVINTRRDLQRPSSGPWKVIDPPYLSRAISPRIGLKVMAFDTH